jgi:Lar family restriction alleviation protein
MGHENGGWMNEDQRDDPTCGGTVVPPTDVSKLLPCPFCGGAPYYTRAVNGTQMHYVGCAACGIAFKAQEIYEPGRTRLTKDIVTAWNQRAQ